VRSREGAATNVVYSLRHDYLCRGILRLQRDSEQSGALLAERYRQYRERASGPLAWWRSLLPLRLQAYLLLARGKGELRFDQSRRFVMLSALRFVPWIGAASAYVALADAGVLLPGQTVIQRTLDRRGLSAFRRPKPLSVIKATASEYRTKLIERLSARVQDGWISSSIRLGDVDAWAHAQAVAAIAWAPESEKVKNLAAPRTLRRLFEPGSEVSEYGWPDPIASTGFGAGFYLSPPIFWMTSAHSSPLLRRRPGALAAAGDGLKSDLAALLRMRESYRADQRRGWTFIAKSNPADASVYSTALGTAALLRLRAAGCPEAASTEIDEDIRAGVEWLASRFATEGDIFGWRETAGDAISEGLTFQVFSALLRSLATGNAPPTVPNLVKKYIPSLLNATATWQVNHPDGVSYFFGHSAVSGQTASFFRNTALLWYPWAIQCASLWVHWARQSGEEESTMRALTHLVVDLKDDMLHRFDGAYTYMISETLYALSAVDEI